MARLSLNPGIRAKRKEARPTAGAPASSGRRSAQAVKNAASGHRYVAEPPSQYQTSPTFRVAKNRTPVRKTPALSPASGGSRTERRRRNSACDRCQSDAITAAIVSRV